MRLMFEGRTCCEANKHLWNSTHWAWHMYKHIRDAEQNPQYLVDWLHDRGGRVFSEAHVPQNLAQSIVSLRAMERSDIWQRSGCRLWIFTMIRYMLNQLHH